jgi:integrase
MTAERKRIGLREVRALPPDAEVFDGGPGSVPGFGARRRTGPGVSYFVMFRTAEGRQRRFTIGTHGAPWTPEAARERAKELLGEVVRGADPSAEKRDRRKAVTVADLCDLYLADVEAGRLLTRRGVAKKPSTVVTDRSRINAHIRPLLGTMRVPAVAPADVEQFMHAVADGDTRKRAATGRKRGLSNVRGGTGAAARTIGLLGALFAYAVRKRMRPDNPVRGVTRFADGRRERRLSDAEYAALGKTLDEAARLPPLRENDTPGKPAMWPAAVAAARFLALTGWRRGEALNLRWGDLDLARRTARLADTKTGESVRPLPAAACDLLRGIGPGRADSLVFPASRGEGPMTGFPDMFARIVREAEMPDDVTPHVLRHSFMSLGNDLGFTEATIGMICGHKGAGRTMTRGYIHPGDAVFGAADRIGAATLRKLAGEAAAGVVEGPGAMSA